MRKWFPAIPIAGAFLFSAAVYSRLPNPMPTHWGLDGQVNGYSSRLVGAFLMPVIGLAIWGFLRGLPRIDPRQANYAKFQGTYDLMIAAIVTVMAVIHVAIVGAALGWPIPHVERLSTLAIGALLLVLGNVLPRARSNWWFGIRTPWTLSSETVWTRTHRVGGYLLAAAGLVTMVSAFLARHAGFSASLTAVIAASLGSVVYSYFVWHKEQS
ncbi:MAG TPA: SdpI family protein [Gemmatimonadales bacterium]|nr:SdpI family protein [Gemmatimonadales bacterium]